jgi:hypothetical protein
MKWIIIISGMWLMALAGCGLREREEVLDKKMSELAQKEQELLLREKSLQLKEKELKEKELILDSTSIKLQLPIDSLSVLHPQLPGTWLVKMTCAETTCPGSAIGDTKTEQWVINYQNNAVIAKAMSNNNLVRVYIGTYSGNSLELFAQQDTATLPSVAKMVVRLQETKENEMEGEREITRAEGCRIVYDLEIKKQ